MSVIISGVDKSIESIFVGIKEFQANKVILLSAKRDELKRVESELENFKVKIENFELNSDNWEEAFYALISQTRKEGKKVIINASLGSPGMLSLLYSAAYIHGIKTYIYNNEKVVMLPILNASYYNLLTKKKEEILQVLTNEECCESMDELSKKTGMSLPLVSYHINGNLRTEGLKEMGLVKTEEVKGRIRIRLSDVGRIIMNSK